MGELARCPCDEKGNATIAPPISVMYRALMGWATPATKALKHTGSGIENWGVRHSKIERVTPLPPKAKCGFYPKIKPRRNDAEKPAILQGLRYIAV